MHACSQAGTILESVCTVSDGESSSSVCYTFPCLIAPLSHFTSQAKTQLLPLRRQTAAFPFSLTRLLCPFSLRFSAPQHSHFLTAREGKQSSSLQQKQNQQQQYCSYRICCCQCPFKLHLKNLQRRKKLSVNRSLSKDKREDDLLPSLFLFFPLTLPAWCCYFFSVCVSAHQHTHT